MPNSSTPTAISAPGKVLLAGGYLVLDRNYTALVFGLSARINVIAQKIETSEGVQLSEIVVISPQFLESQWRYGYHLAAAEGGFKVTQLHVGQTINQNPFVETALSYALTYISYSAHHLPTHTITASQLTILADNDYYSQSDSSQPGDKKIPNRFAKFPTNLKDAHKTGLGSSAALVTALTAALLSHYLPPTVFDINTLHGKRTLHNLAQAAHCAAQGKIGSGFDVAAAVYGSCRYRRFSPSILVSLPEPGAPGFAPALLKLVDDKEGKIWDVEIEKEGVRLPPGVTLRMCDVDCGTQTVGMVKQALAWRAAQPEKAGKLWDSLQERNVALGNVLAEGNTEQIVSAVSAIRELIRAMGTESGTPIEPEAQTALLDALAEVEGVYNGVVPGAGGFDAVALLVKDDEGTEGRVKECVRNWGEERGGRVRLLGVKGEMEGVRREELGSYEGWLA
ncbi:phosphomevalonate kinase [Pseudomassariella vexata]|uniref:Phosphomevalonate kinase n=1 Tax=Pseudomassariella vexata TaxID=1141098 RepID=A0A1Y2DKH0_9PEZI|nr:phosphomevalonate kinase [Pseudomassariella vexata]ORY59733.1 phosphomevalonate kinase [Pseudomassariella vexata]